VEGTINAGNLLTEIVLKRTVKLDNPTILYEAGAIVSVMGEDNSIFPLNEKTTGHYQASNLALNKLKKYKLRIQTKSSKVYESDFVEVRNTPAIDSISKHMTIVDWGFCEYTRQHWFEQILSMGLYRNMGIQFAI